MFSRNSQNQVPRIAALLPRITDASTVIYCVLEVRTELFDELICIINVSCLAVGIELLA